MTSITQAVVDAIQQQLEHDAKTWRTWTDIAIQRRTTAPPTIDSAANTLRQGLDNAAIHTITEHALHTGMPDHELVHLIRGQYREDYRPNKNITPATVRLLFHGYPMLNDLLQMAEHGFIPHTTTTRPTQLAFPDNHKSATTNIGAVAAHIAAGQESGTMLLLNDHVLEHPSRANHQPLHCSPYCVVAKRARSQAQVNVFAPIYHGQEGRP